MPTAFVPTVIESTSRGERAYDLYSRMLGDHIIFLSTPLDETVANLICAQMLHLESVDSDRDINLYINSPGGDVVGLLAIYDTMCFVRNDISTICFGQAASAAAILLAAGSPGKRYALPNSRILLHQPSSGAGGQVSDIEIQAKEIARLRSNLEDILSRHTGRTAVKLRSDMERDLILSPGEAQAYGVIDDIVYSRAVPEGEVARPSR
jgi:ATP-dependent Clp protease, protease subunit